MSRLGCLLLVLCMACAGSKPDPNEPQTAREKQLRDAKAKGELDSPTGKWAGWRYRGDREDCFYVVGRSCFRSKKVACGAAHCPMDRCKVIGGGPATLQCKKKPSG